MKTLTVKIIPRSSQNQIVGEQEDGTLKIKLTAAPVDGAANKALVELLSKHFGVSKSKIKIIKGETNKIKIVAVDV